MPSARISSGAGTGKGRNMPSEAIQMQQVGEALAEQPAHPRSSYLGRVLSRTWALVTLAGSRSHDGKQPDGLEAFDMLGGWKSPDTRRRNVTLPVDFASNDMLATENPADQERPA